VKELRRRSASSVVARMKEVNTRRRFVDILPTEIRVSRWIEEAKLLDPIVTY
jgi:hypothetical protein